MTKLLVSAPPGGARATGRPAACAFRSSFGKSPRLAVYLHFSLLTVMAAGLIVLTGGAAALRGQTLPAGPSGPAASAPSVRIDLQQAIQLALAHNHALQAARTTIPQSQAQEITASLRPNPVLLGDSLFVPLFSPSNLNSSTLDVISEFDLGVSYLIERGHKRQARIRAAKD
ncbi:MAG: TolC family protein, partial [Terriglobia bacterium]